jgi:FkbM family methyltransferase
MTKFKLLKTLTNRIFNKEVKISFTKNGEDLMLADLFSNKNTGCYIDIGCYDPVLHSNTFLFYLKGWRGINIDANPDKIALFNNKRREDVNINLAISENGGFVDYYEVEGDDSMNTINPDFVKNIINPLKRKIRKKTQIESKTLEELLDNHIDASQKVDFISIDVEGAEMGILKSNNWGKYNFSVILVETQINMQNIDNNDIIHYLKSKGYVLYSLVPLNKSIANIFFINESLDWKNLSIPAL